jgi:hypothetical protein
MVCALHASETALDASKRADIRSELIQQDRRMLAHCLTINEPWEG